MNIVFGMRGEKDLQNHIANELNFQEFMQPKIKDGVLTHDKIQRCLQPIQLYCLVAPKEYANQIFSSLNFKDEDRYRYGSLKMKMAFAGMRKAMNLKPIPKFQEVEDKFKIPLTPLKRFIHFFPIGIKEDVIGIDENGFTKEML